LGQLQFLASDQTHASQLERVRRVRNITGRRPGHRESPLSLYMRDSGLYCYFIIPAHTPMCKNLERTQNKYLSSPASWSSLGHILDHWRMAEQRFRFDVLMRGVLLLSFPWRARRNHARDQKRCSPFFGRKGGCAIESNITGLSLSACLHVAVAGSFATGWVYAFGVSCLLLVAVADSCDWLLSCLDGLHTRGRRGHHVLFNDVYRRFGSGYPHPG
jgi:hypothetical protein